MDTALGNVSINLNQASALVKAPASLFVAGVTVLLISSVFTVMTSILSSYAVFRDKELYKKTENPFLLSLVVSDGLLSIGWTSFAVFNMLLQKDGQVVKPTVTVRLWGMFRYYHFTSAVSALYISLNRILLITRPYPKYLRLQNRRNVVIMILIAWLIVLLFQAQEFFFPTTDSEPECLLGSRGLAMRFIVILRGSVVYLFPWWASIFVNLILIYLIRIKVRRSCPSNNNTVAKDKHTGAVAQRKLIRVTSISESVPPTGEPATKYLSGLPLPEVASSMVVTTETDQHTHSPKQQRRVKKTISVSDLLISPFIRSNGKRDVEYRNEKYVRNTKCKSSSLILSISLVFVGAVFTLPFGIYLALTFWIPSLHSPFIWMFVFTLTFLNPAGNSIVYVLSNRKIRFFYVKLLNKYSSFRLFGDNKR